MRGLIVGTILGGAAMIAAAAPANATVTFGDAYGNGVVLGSNSYAQATAVPGVSPSQYNNDHEKIAVATLPASPLVVTSGTSANDTQGTIVASAIASNRSIASFLSAASGSVAFVGGASATAAGGNDGFAAAANSYYFQYSFSTDAAAGFSFDYALSGPVIGCCGNSVQLYDRTAGTSLIYAAQYDRDLNGTLTADLTAGHDYYLQVTKGEYYSVDAPYVGPYGIQSFTHDDHFDFSITSAADPAPAAVPEPASWALMIAGVGLVGGRLRRRKRGVAVRFA